MRSFAPRACHAPAAALLVSLDCRSTRGPHAVQGGRFGCTARPLPPPEPPSERHAGREAGGEASAKHACLSSRGFFQVLKAFVDALVRRVARPLAHRPLVLFHDDVLTRGPAGKQGRGGRHAYRTSERAVAVTWREGWLLCKGVLPHRGARCAQCLCACACLAVDPCSGRRWIRAGMPWGYWSGWGHAGAPYYSLRNGRFPRACAGGLDGRRGGRGGLAECLAD